MLHNCLMPLSCVARGQAVPHQKTGFKACLD